MVPTYEKQTMKYTSTEKYNHISIQYLKIFNIYNKNDQENCDRSYIPK